MMFKKKLYLIFQCIDLDPFYTSVGMPVPPTVEGSSRIDISQTKIYLKYAKFNFKGRLLGFEYYVKDKGKFELLVCFCDNNNYFNACMLLYICMTYNYL